jgi:nucleoside-diphosphate-sugar epimerase
VPIDEAHPMLPLSPYANSKLAAEAYCHAYARAYGMNTVILRFFNIYGPDNETPTPV